MKKYLGFGALLASGFLIWNGSILVSDFYVFMLFIVISLVLTPLIALIIKPISALLIHSFLGQLLGPRSRRIFELLFYVPSLRRRK